MGLGRLAIRAHRLLHQRALFGPERGIHHALLRVRRPLADRQVSPLKVCGVELTLQHLLGVGVPGHHQQARGSPVQAVDRVGVRLGFAFPAGAQVSELAAQCTERIRPKASVKGTQCSLSGLENQCNQLLAAGKSPAYVCRYCLLCVAETAYKMVVAALEDHPGLPVVFAGGVMSSDIIQKELSVRLPCAHFVPGRFSSDNAIGVALLAAREVAHD